VVVADRFADAGRHAGGGVTVTSLLDLRVNDIKLLAAMLAGCVLTDSRGIGKWSRGCIVKISHLDGRYRDLRDGDLWRIEKNEMVSIVSSEFAPDCNRRLHTYGLTPAALEYLAGRRYRLDLDKYLEVKITPETLLAMACLRDGCRVLITHTGGHNVIDDRGNYKLGFRVRQFETFVERFMEHTGTAAFSKCKIYSFTDAGREWLAANVKPAASAAQPQETTT
jgi:hypothetical protein